MWIVYEFYPYSVWEIFQLLFDDANDRFLHCSFLLVYFLFYHFLINFAEFSLHGSEEVNFI